MSAPSPPSCLAVIPADAFLRSHTHPTRTPRRYNQTPIKRILAYFYVLPTIAASLHTPLLGTEDPQSCLTSLPLLGTCISLASTVAAAILAFPGFVRHRARQLHFVARLQAKLEVLERRLDRLVTLERRLDRLSRVLALGTEPVGALHSHPVRMRVMMVERMRFLLQMGTVGSPLMARMFPLGFHEDVGNGNGKVL